MLDLNPIFEFSRTHCVALCTFLVPFNLLTTLTTLILTGLRQPTSQVQRFAGLAIAGSTIMVLHVLTWFMIHVVMMQTFVLLGLAVCCWSLNTWAIAHPASLRHLLQALATKAQHLISTTKANRANV